MIPFLRPILFATLLACGPSLASDLYRCDLPDGRTVYQATQCELGEQRAIDTRNARREQMRKSMEAERKQQPRKPKKPAAAL